MKKNLKTIVAVLSIAAMLISSTVMATDIKSFSDNLHVYLNNVDMYVNSNYKPIILNDRTMVRLVPILESMGYTHKYDDKTKSAEFSKNNCSYIFNNGSLTTYAVKDGQKTEFSLDVPAIIYNDVFYVPLRAFCNMVNININWNNATRSVYLESSDLIHSSAKSKLTVDEARELLHSRIGDLGTWMDGEPNVLVCDGSVHNSNGKEYYQFILRGLVDGHMTTLDWYVVSVDGTEMFNGQCNNGKLDKWGEVSQIDIEA